MIRSFILVLMIFPSFNYAFAALETFDSKKSEDFVFDQMPSLKDLGVERINFIVHFNSNKVASEISLEDASELGLANNKEELEVFFGQYGMTPEDVVVLKTDLEVFATIDGCQRKVKSSAFPVVYRLDKSSNNSESILDMPNAAKVIREVGKELKNSNPCQ